MNKIIDGSHGTAGTRREGGRRLDWRKRMSDTVAYGLLVYTALQIFVTMHAVEGRGGSLLPLVGLVVLVAAIIPLYRRYERRWEVLDNDRAADPSLRSAYRRDQLAVWLLSIGLPFLLTGLYKVIVAVI